MKAADVVDFYVQCKAITIDIWIDGGWGVDALLGKQLRTHHDLDIAIQWQDVPKLCEMLTSQGYRRVEESSQWNFVLSDDKNHVIDVHAFIFDERGNIVEGVMYPSESLSGMGMIAGHPVKCISPQYMVEFLAPWLHKWPHKYLPAVQQLCEKFSITLPKEYKQISRNKRGITIMPFSLQDAHFFVESFAQLGWNKPLAQFAEYLREEAMGLRSNFVAKQRDQTLGYVTILWESDHPYFQERGIPEIKDLNVLPQFRGKGAGKALLRVAEQEIAKRVSLAGIGVGLTKDYAAAQLLYIKNGYLPNGEGATTHHQTLEYGTICQVDDDLVLWLVKELKDDN